MSEIRLLVVDDDRANTELVSRILGDAGYTVESASDGPSALELVRQRPFSLAVLDYQMPEMDGVELYKNIVEIQPDVVGVFLTSYTSLDTVYPAIMSGIERILPKPVVRDELIALVRNLIGGPSPGSPVSN